MSAIFLALGAVAFLGGIGCSLYILVDAFQDEIWKGLVCLLCGLYFLYYALFEFDHDAKWQIVLGALFGSTIGAGFVRLAQG